MAEKKLIVKIASDVSQLKNGMKQAQGSLDSFKSQVKQVASAIGVAFAVDRVVDFSLEVSKLAGAAKGVKTAFDRLENSAVLMQRMKQATHNTVSELELMKRAVQADNFKISLQALPRLLEFATIRAQQTGQSVDYLVDSIVTGIGRKSALILDNLGISASELREQLQQTPDYAEAVANIISREMPKMGGFVDNAATSIQQLNASIEELKLTWGNFLNNTFLHPRLINAMDGFLKRWNQIFTGKKANPERDLKLAIEVFNAQGMSKGKEKFFENLNNVKALAKEVGVDLIQLREKANGVFKIFIKPTPVTFIDGTKDKVVAATAAVQTLGKEIQKLPKGFTGDVGKSMSGSDAITAFFDPKRLEGPLDKIKTKLAEMQAPVIDFQQNLQKLGLVAIDVGAIMENAMTTGLTAFADALGSALGGAQDFGKTFVQALIGLARQVGQILIGIGSAALAVKKQLVANPALVIAAGVALVALAGAANAAINRAAGSFGGGGSAGANVRAIDSGSFRQQAMVIEVVGETRMDGNTLVTALRKADYQTSKLGGRRG